MRTDLHILPPQRRKVFEFIAAEIAAGRPFPKMIVIATHMGWRNEGSVRDVLNALTGSGFLRRSRNERGRFVFSMP